MCCYWPLVLLTRSVGRYPRGEGLDPPGVTALAEHVIVQGIAGLDNVIVILTVRTVPILLLGKIVFGYC